ncbi:MAG: type II toxin-antitoxin system HicB family antitoxin [Bryobacteraceae bacterium]
MICRRFSAPRPLVGAASTFYNEGMKRNSARSFSYSVFYEQAAEGGYVAFVPALPGCHTQGESLEETERNVKEAIALYLESLLAHGEAIPEEGQSFQGRVGVPVSVPA